MDSSKQLSSNPEPKSSSKTDRRVIQRTSRNAACPCGSGKKYKHCHMRQEASRFGSATTLRMLMNNEIARFNKGRKSHKDEADIQRVINETSELIGDLLTIDPEEKE